MIDVRELKKTFRVQKRAPGLAGAVSALFAPKYEDVDAVKGVSFRIEPGERVGFLGPNGAGKTTTLKMLAGLLHPSGGEVKVGGHVPKDRGRDFLTSITLVLGQKQQLNWDLPPNESFELNRAVYDVDRLEFERTKEELVSILGIAGVIGKPTRQLSLGERMKCELACALLHEPRYLFLDEPTIGLDVMTQHAVREFIRRYNEKHGATVMLTSHYMADVEALCPRVVIIDEGDIRFDGTIAALAARVQTGKNVTLTLESEVARERLLELGSTPEVEGTQVVFRVPGESLRDFVSAALQKLPVRDFNVQDPPLEEMLSALLGKKTAHA
ncbi:MAG: ATP-binding cassette domain-containing protein [Polyangiaceae bacterium]